MKKKATKDQLAFFDGGAKAQAGESIESIRSAALTPEAERLLENFEVISTADGGADRLRTLTFSLAIHGKLLPSEKREDRLGTALAAESMVALSPPPELPPGWEWQRVDHVGEVKLGRQRSPQNHTGPNMRPYLRVANVHEARIDLSHVLEMNFSPDEVTRFALRRDDVLLNEGQSYELVGRPAMYGGEIPGACFQNTLIRFRAYACVLPQYALLVFRAYLRNGRFRREAQQTTNMAHLSAGRLSAIEFPLPPLAEQARIVAKVDDLMALCDEMEARQAKRRVVAGRLNKAALGELTTAEGPEEFAASLQRVVGNFEALADKPESVKQLRELILELAVRGKLVAQDPIDARTATAATPGHLDATAEGPYPLPIGWHWARVGALYDVAGGIQKTPRRAPVQNHFPYLRVENVQRGRLDLARIDHFELFDDELRKRRLEVGDILVVEGNGSETEIGRCAIWDGSIADCVHQNHIIRCRPSNRATSTFTVLFFNSPSGMTEMRNLAITTSGLFSLSVGKIRNILLPNCPLAEQARIVAKVDHLLALCDTLEATIRAADEGARRLAESLVAELLA